MKFLATVLLSIICISPALADITAENAHQDTAHYDACSAAFDLESESTDAFADAIKKCIGSMIYYTQQIESNPPHEKSCHAYLYTGSSSLMSGYLVNRSLNKNKAPKLFSYAVESLKWVIANCADEPKMQHAAKGVLHGYEYQVKNKLIE